MRALCILNKSPPCVCHWPSRLLLLYCPNERTTIQRHHIPVDTLGLTPAQLLSFSNRGMFSNHSCNCIAILWKCSSVLQDCWNCSLMLLFLSREFASHIWITFVPIENFLFLDQVVCLVNIWLSLKISVNFDLAIFDLENE